MKKIRILTTQNVAVEYQLAQVGERIIANIIDYFIKGGYIISIMVLANLTKFDSGGSKDLILILLALIPFMLYNVLMEVFMGGADCWNEIKKNKSDTFGRKRIEYW